MMNAEGRSRTSMNQHPTSNAQRPTSKEDVGFLERTSCPRGVLKHTLLQLQATCRASASQGQRARHASPLRERAGVGGMEIWGEFSQGGLWGRPIREGKCEVGSLCGAFTSTDRRR